MLDTVNGLQIQLLKNLNVDINIEGDNRGDDNIDLEVGNGAKGKRKSQGELKTKDLFNRRLIKATQTTINGAFKKEIREDACKDILLFFFYNNDISFNVARSDQYIKMFDFVAKHGLGFKPLSYHEIRVKYLDFYYGEISKVVVGYWSDREKYGYTILNFLVHSPNGTIFLKSIYASDITKTAGKVFEMIDDVVKDVGEGNVVQIVADNAMNYKAVKKLLMQKRSCFEHHVVEEAVEENVVQIVTDNVANYKVTGELLMRKRMLRKVDSEEKATMRYLYEEMNLAKEKIKSNVNGVARSYNPLWNIIVQRWDKQLHRPLHVVGLYLNTKIHYAPGFIDDDEERKRLRERVLAMRLEKLIPKMKGKNGLRMWRMTKMKEMTSHLMLELPPIDKEDDDDDAVEMEDNEGEDGDLDDYQDFGLIDILNV
ncbi:uncharacterized protein LOC123896422 [Trifolium pratense]|uniref:uncharacterized protein LOC123896422 n=1 Tax=Trifolium pratense TaxID=57577 RepID=UPI001E691E89|nr:uncharacterized protein LOC123896422 [Trifolium pratense]